MFIFFVYFLLISKKSIAGSSRKKKTKKEEEEEESIAREDQNLILFHCTALILSRIKRKEKTHIRNMNSIDSKI